MSAGRRGSIAFRLPAAAAGLLLLMVGAMTTGAYLEVRRSALAVAEQRLDQVTAELAGQLRGNAMQRFAAARAVASEPAVVAHLRAPGPGTAAQAEARLDALAEGSAQVRAIELWDATGERLLAAGSGLDPLDEDLSRALLASIVEDEGAGVGPFQLVSDTVMYAAIARVPDGERVAGFVVQRLAVTGSPQAARRLAELIGADAHLAIGAEGGSVWTDLATDVPGPRAAPLEGEDLLRYTRADGVPVLARTAGVPSTPWLVAVELPAAPVFAPARAFLVRSLFASLLLAALGVGAAWWLSRRITGPLGELTEAAEALSAGQPARSVSVDRSDELGRLEASFNAMAAQVEQARQELEAKVVERTAALEAANRELEAFSYSVSHDMRAPLRAIDGFSRILLEDHAAELSPEARGLLDTIVRNSKQMGLLIDDLLMFSRVGRQEMRGYRVDMTALAEQAADEARRAEPGRVIELEVRPLPPAHGEPALLRQVMANVIQNAVKFTRTREIARIEVGHRDADGQVVYYVRDNGVGFDVRYADKMFGVFQRLHRAEDFEGTGVGLAIVQRIVQRHGGRVWAESEPECGATFHFTLSGNGHDG